MDVASKLRNIRVPKKWRILFGVAEPLLSSHEFCFSSRKAQVKTNHNNYMQPGWGVNGGPVVIVSITTSYGRVTRVAQC